MSGTLQPLDQKFAIVDTRGNPTEYFIRWAQQKQIDIGDSITLTDLQDYLTAHMLVEGSGIQFTPDGNINNSPTIAADVQEILDQITATRGAVLYRGLLGWAALLPGTAGLFLQTAGAGADPLWAAAGGGGSTDTFIGVPSNIRPNSGTSFGISNFGCRSILVPRDCTIYATAGYCTVAAATGKFTPGIYNLGAGGIVGSLVATGPQVTGAAVGLNVWSLTTPLVVTAGTFLWVGVQELIAAASFSTLSNQQAIAFFAAAGALPATAPAANYGTTSAMSFFAKIVP